MEYDLFEIEKPIKKKEGGFIVLFIFLFIMIFGLYFDLHLMH